MLHRRKTAELVGMGERVPHPYSVGDTLILSSYERVARKRKRKSDPIEYDIVVYAYRILDGLERIGYDGFAPHELGLFWSDETEPQPPRNKHKAWWKHHKQEPEPCDTHD